MVYKAITIIPSKTSPSAKAPKQEIVIKAFSLIPLPSKYKDPTSNVGLLPYLSLPPYYGLDKYDAMIIILCKEIQAQFT